MFYQILFHGVFRNEKTGLPFGRAGVKEHGAERWQNLRRVGDGKFSSSQDES